MGRTFRIKLRFRRFGRRHPWLTFTLRSFMIFSIVFGAALTLVARETAAPVMALLEGVFKVIAKVIDIVMK